MSGAIYQQGKAMPHTVGEIGEYVVAATLAAIAWTVGKFANRHIASMDRLTEKLETISGDVREMKVDIRTLKHHAESVDKRIDRLEHPE